MHVPEQHYLRHEVPYIPDTGDVPLVADVSSCFLSEPLDVSKFGIVYGGAQKNVAPAGLTSVIVRKDLIGKSRDITPAMLDYKNMADNDSMYNTPPCWSIYMCKLVLEWIEKLGGLEEMKKRNEAKAKILYDFIDSGKMFSNPVRHCDRSLMNVTFVTKAMAQINCRRGGRGGICQPQGTPFGRRNARVHIQRHAGRGSRAAC